MPNQKTNGVVKVDLKGHSPKRLEEEYTQLFPKAVPGCLQPHVLLLPNEDKDIIIESFICKKTTNMICKVVETRLELYPLHQNWYIFPLLHPCIYWASNYAGLYTNPASILPWPISPSILQSPLQHHHFH